MGWGAPLVTPKPERAFPRGDRTLYDTTLLVWARDMGEMDNEELLQYFHNRHVWRIDADQSTPRLEP